MIPVGLGNCSKSGRVPIQAKSAYHGYPVRVEKEGLCRTTST
jgi:hypothetical protein